MSENKTVIDLNDDELRAVTRIQQEVQARYLGKMPSMQVFAAMENELKTRMAEAGFEVSVLFIPYGEMVVPQVTFIGRTDKQLERLIQTATDFERKTWDAQHTSTKELVEEGIDLDLLE